MIADHHKGTECPQCGMHRATIAAWAEIDPDEGDGGVGLCWDYPQCQDTRDERIAKLRADNEKLRAALFDEYAFYDERHDFFYCVGCADADERAPRQRCKKKEDIGHVPGCVLAHGEESKKEGTT